MNKRLRQLYNRLASIELNSNEKLKMSKALNPLLKNKLLQKAHKRKSMNFSLNLITETDRRMTRNKIINFPKGFTEEKNDGFSINSKNIIKKNNEGKVILPILKRKIILQNFNLKQFQLLSPTRKKKKSKFSSLYSTRSSYKNAHNPLASTSYYCSVCKCN